VHAEAAGNLRAHQAAGILCQSLATGSLLEVLDSLSLIFAEKM